MAAVREPGGALAGAYERRREWPEVARPTSARIEASEGAPTGASYLAAMRSGSALSVEEGRSGDTG